MTIQFDVDAFLYHAIAKNAECQGSTRVVAVYHMLPTRKLGLCSLVF